jgi:hypothetical protein
MSIYKITATRESVYEFEIEADTEEEAIAEMERIEREEDVEVYAYDWYPVEVYEIEEIIEEQN